MIYPNFIYKDYKILEDDKKITIIYNFEIEGLTNFEPKIEILKKDFKWKNLKSNIFKNLVFNLGMVEAISYFKATCSKNFYIKCGYLNTEQAKWFRKLYYLGLGEFRYKNKITTSEEEFVKFISLGKELELEELKQENLGIIVPIGGGKDSNVTLELLKNEFEDINPFRINATDVSYECVETAGYKRNEIIEVNRIIDKNLLKLNEQGFLNGHTPFSAMVAFLTCTVAFLLGKKYVTLSNEESANESNVSNQNINHQYSKTFEFENDFRYYENKFLKTNAEYFSFLRPISELQIAYIFSKLEKYHKVFKSCNVGSKQKPWVWCGNCPKCLFVYIMLSAFLETEKLIQIFGEDLYTKENLLNTFIELCGFGEIKPFECVGTFSEVRYAVSRAIENRIEKLPFLLKYYKEHYKLENTSDNILKYYNDNNNLPIEFENILKERL